MEYHVQQYIIYSGGRGYPVALSRQTPTTAAVPGTRYLVLRYYCGGVGAACLVLIVRLSTCSLGCLGAYIPPDASNATAVSADSSLVYCRMWAWPVQHGCKACMSSEMYTETWRGGVRYFVALGIKRLLHTSARSAVGLLSRLTSSSN